MKTTGNGKRFHFRSALLGGLVAALVVSALPAIAAQVGDALRLGEANRINGRTNLRGNAAANLTIIGEGRAGSGATALDLRVKEGNPPMKVNSSVKVEGLNADRVDGVDGQSLADRVAELESILGMVSRDGDKLVVTGNLQVINGSGGTSSSNGLGNVIIGYNQSGQFRDQTGSHNLVIGDGHTFTSDASIVSGLSNTVTGDFSFASGENHTASGTDSFVGGGLYNEATADGSFVGGGGFNTASGFESFVGGGGNNVASGTDSFVGGGERNTASGFMSFVGGGRTSTASGDDAFVGGGRDNFAGPGTCAYIVSVLIGLC